MAINPTPATEAHLPTVLLYVDRCHSELTFTVSLKHQIKLPTLLKALVLGKVTSSPSGFCVPVIQEVSYWEEEATSEHGSQGLEVLAPHL